MLRTQTQLKLKQSAYHSTAVQFIKDRSQCVVGTAGLSFGKNIL